MTRIEQSIEINVPVGTAYRQLTQFEQYPRFMEDVEEVRQLDDTHLHWHTKTGNLDMEWDGKFIVCAELAGVKREDVSVEVSGDRLTIEGERRQEPPHGPQEQRRSERSYGHFYRVISLPAGAQGEAASASLQDGLLEITVPLAEGGKNARRIEVQSRR